MTREEYGLVYHSDFPKTVRFLLSQGAVVQVAEEVAQAAWARGWERREQFKGDSNIVTWVNAIARNRYRAEFRHPRMEKLLDLEIGQFTPEFDARVDLQKILKLCTPDERRILDLRLLEYDFEEIGCLEGISEVGARIKAFRAYGRLRGLVAGRIRPNLFNEVLPKVCLAFGLTRIELRKEHADSLAKLAAVIALHRKSISLVEIARFFRLTEVRVRFMVAEGKARVKEDEEFAQRMKAIERER